MPPGDRRDRFYVNFKSKYFRKYWRQFSQYEWYLRRTNCSKIQLLLTLGEHVLTKYGIYKILEIPKKTFSELKMTTNFQCLNFSKSQLLLTKCEPKLTFWKIRATRISFVLLKLFNKNALYLLPTLQERGSYHSPGVHLKNAPAPSRSAPQNPRTQRVRVPTPRSGAPTPH